VGKWHSLYLASDATPWADDLACAQAAHEALGVEIRCSPGSWDEKDGEEDADRWLKVSDQGVEQIDCRTRDAPRGAACPWGSATLTRKPRDERGFDSQRAAASWACRPFCPGLTANSTCCPSVRVRCPSPRMAR